MTDGAGHVRTNFDAYRPDIDGLRAVAVLGVVAFHLGFNGGGFVGVDIFFVISGFLITGILIDELASGKPGTAILARFYERRVRRIAPALIAMCLITYVAAVIWLFPEDLKEFGRSLQSVAIFVSNFHFQRKTGYFDGVAEEKPLLHTWSLAVEEQYYILFPLALWAFWRWRGPAAALIACLAVAFFSLIYAEIQVRATPEIAFFSTPSRIWELLAGALLAMTRERLPATRSVREALATLGAVLIAWPYAMYSSATTFPGISAAVPVLGSGLLIAAGVKGTTLISRLLATPVLVGVGLISYSVYLWHWPLMVFAKYRFGSTLEQHSTSIPALLFVSSLLLGYLSWRFVEQPFRRPSPRQPRFQVFAIQTLLTLLMVLAGMALIRLHGLPGRWPQDVLALLQPEVAERASHLSFCHPATPERYQQIRICGADAGTSPSGNAIMLWGDSHAGVLSDALVRRAGKHPAILTAISAACPPLAGVVLGGRSRSDRCRHHNEMVLDYLAQEKTRVSTVMLVARWAYYAEGTRMPFEPGQPVILGDGKVKDAPQVLQHQLAETLRRLLMHVDNIVILAPPPEFDRPIAVSLARARIWGDPPLDKQSRSSVNRRQKSALDALHKAAQIEPRRIKVISPLSYFCDTQSCSFADDDGRPLFSDTNHLSEVGIARLMPLLEEILASSNRPPL